jgi:hypothetical protein
MWWIIGGAAAWLIFMALFIWGNFKFWQWLEPDTPAKDATYYEDK